MAIGAITAGAKALAKKAGKGKAPKATPKQAANLNRIESRDRSGTTMAQDIHRGIKEFRNNAVAVTRSSDRRLARRGAAATGAAVAAPSTISKGPVKGKPKTADPVASRSRTGRQRDR